MFFFSHSCNQAELGSPRAINRRCRTFQLDGKTVTIPARDELHLAPLQDLHKRCAATQDVERIVKCDSIDSFSRTATQNLCSQARN